MIDQHRPWRPSSGVNAQELVILARVGVLTAIPANRAIGCVDLEGASGYAGHLIARQLLRHSPRKNPVLICLFHFQDSAGLNFGTMDFIIDVTGKWIFLETNPMGQFLWIEVVRPDTPILDAFVEFIISGSDDFIYGGPKDEAARMSTFRQEEPSARRAFIAAERERHVQAGERAATDRPLAS